MKDLPVFYLKEANWWENLKSMDIKDNDQMFKKKKNAQRRHVASIPSWKFIAMETSGNEINIH